MSHPARKSDKAPNDNASSVSKANGKSRKQEFLGMMELAHTSDGSYMIFIGRPPNE
jgi:hypothetical protein